MNSLPRFGEAERRRRLVVRHRLHKSRRTDDVAEVADDLLGLHSSDPASVYLSAAARIESPKIEAISDALYEHRKILRVHAMRRTLWVLPPHLARIAHSATTVRYIPRERERLLKMLDEGTQIENPADWITESASRVLELLDDGGPIDTRTIGNLLPELRHSIDLAQGKRYATTVSALSRLLLQMGFEGRIFRGEPIGSWISSQYRWEGADGWFPDGFEPIDPSTARADLVAAWLERFGPGTERDIAWWTGLPLGMVRGALSDVGAVAVDIGGESAWVNPGDSESDEDPGPSVALLPGLDPSTMGWKQRDWYLNPDHVDLLFDRNGNGGPTVWVDGRIVGGWVQDSAGQVAYRLVEDVGAQSVTAIDEEAARLESFWGDVRFNVRFPAPLQRQLTG